MAILISGICNLESVIEGKAGRGINNARVSMTDSRFQISAEPLRARPKVSQYCVVLERATGLHSPPT